MNPGIFVKRIFSIVKTAIPLLVIFLALGVISANAQFVPSTGTNSSSKAAKVLLPEPLTPAAVRELVSKLSDQQVRSLLLERLDTVAKEEQHKKAGKEAGIGGLLETWIGSVAGNFVTAVVRIPKIWDGLQTAISSFAEKHGPWGAFKFIGIIIGAISAGLIAEYLVNQLTRSQRQRIQKLEDNQSLLQTLKVLGSRLFWDLL